jgi:hypothetical protein
MNEAEKCGDAVMNVAVPLLAEMRKEISYWMKEAGDGNAVVMTLLRENLELHHNRRMVELRYQRATVWRQAVLTMLPATMRHFLRRFTKRAVVPDGMADTAILEAAAHVIRRMPPEDQVRALSAFPPELMMIVGERIMEICERQEKEEASSVAASRAESGSMLDDIVAAEEASPETH